MKNLFNLLGIVLISLSIVSCGGEENNETDPNKEENTLTEDQISSSDLEKNN